MRTSKAVAVLVKHEAALNLELQTLIAKQASVEESLERVKELRREMEAVPKRTSKAKNRVAAATNSDYNKRKARDPERTDEHYPFFVALKNGGRVWRDDKKNGVQEWLTLEHPGIQGHAANIVYFGYRDLSLPEATLANAAPPTATAA